jgi:hypothetical protein
LTQRAPSWPADGVGSVQCTAHRQSRTSK